MDNLTAYAAGFFDGEGSIIISKGRKYNRRYLRVHIGQIWPAALDLLKDQWGGSVFRHKSRPKGRTFSEWVITGQGAQKFLWDIYPLLNVKKNQARLALYYPCGTNSERIKITPELHLFRDSLRNALMAENRRRPTIEDIVESSHGS